MIMRGVCTLGAMCLLLIGIVHPIKNGSTLAAKECTGSNRCIRASECRRILSEEVQNVQKDKVFFNCGFQGVSLLVCCPIENDVKPSVEKHTVISTDPLVSHPPVNLPPVLTALVNRENLTSPAVLPLQINPYHTPPVLTTEANLLHATTPLVESITQRNGSPPRQQNKPLQTTETQQNDLTRHKNFRLLPQDICGTSAVIPNRIVNGQDAVLGEFPWMAILGHKSEDTKKFISVCGGTLISWKYVLTSAHCIKRSVRVVRLGEHVLSTDPDSDEGGLWAEPVVDIEIERAIKHPQYNNPILRNDIGLIRLRHAQSRLFSSYIRPICLPLETERLNPGHKLQVAGWGINSRGSPNGSNILQKAILLTIGQEDCGDAQEDHAFKTIFQSQMCTAVTENQTSVCHGDSGGPLMDFRKSPRSPTVIVQLGIVSLGAGDCGLNGTPPIYTRVSSFTKWILDTMQD